MEDNFSDEDNRAAASAVRGARSTAQAPVKKSVATRKRSDSEREETDPYGAANPARFVAQSAGELKQVVWPTWPQLVSYFSAVLVFVLFFIVFIGLLDLFFGWGLLSLFGDDR
nr:preprotein translocase subunit SecE [Tessaracoccus sp. OS52]